MLCRLGFAICISSVRVRASSDRSFAFVCFSEDAAARRDASEHLV